MHSKRNKALFGIYLIFLIGIMIITTVFFLGALVDIKYTVEPGTTDKQIVASAYSHVYTFVGIIYSLLLLGFVFSILIYTSHRKITD